MTRHRQQSRRGFTLIEMMLVVAVLAILASLALPAFLRAQFRARQAEVPVVLGLLRNGMLAFHAANDCYMDVDPNPAAIPVGGTPAPLDNAISGTTPCTPGSITLADLDLDIGAPVWHQYECAAVTSGSGQPGYACDATGDLDSDGANALWVFCSDDDRDQICDGPSPKGSVAPLINTPVRVSPERF